MSNKKTQKWIVYLMIIAMLVSTIGIGISVLL